MSRLSTFRLSSTTLSADESSFTSVTVTPLTADSTGGTFPSVTDGLLVGTFQLGDGSELGDAGFNLTHINASSIDATDISGIQESPTATLVDVVPLEDASEATISETNIRTAIVTNDIVINADTIAGDTGQQSIASTSLAATESAVTTDTPATTAGTVSPQTATDVAGLNDTPVLTSATASPITVTDETIDRTDTPVVQSATAQSLTDTVATVTGDDPTTTFIVATPSTSPSSSNLEESPVPVSVQASPLTVDAEAVFNESGVVTSGQFGTRVPVEQTITNAGSVLKLAVASHVGQSSEAVTRDAATPSSATVSPLSINAGTSSTEDNALHTVTVSPLSIDAGTSSTEDTATTGTIATALTAGTLGTKTDTLSPESVSAAPVAPTITASSTENLITSAATSTSVTPQSAATTVDSSLTQSVTATAFVGLVNGVVIRTALHNVGVTPLTAVADGVKTDGSITPMSASTLTAERAPAIQNAVRDGSNSVEPMAFSIKQNDTSPALQRRLRKVDGSPQPLDNVDNIRFYVIDDDYNVVVSDDLNGNVIITDAPTGEVQYEFASDDLEQAGLYRGEFEVTFSGGGGTETFPNSGYIEIEVTSDIL